MTSVRWHFKALLSRIEPSSDRRSLAQKLPGEVRKWLQDHDYETVQPHTRLSGSYARATAILDIPDVDVLVFRPDTDLDRTPNAVVLDLKKVLDDYPDAKTSTTAQRRSVRLVFESENLHLDLVPVVAGDGSETTIKLPSRERAEWIDSDPLGYAQSLSDLNSDHSDRVVPLIKLVKAWRDVQMQMRRPKSYVLEVMVFHAVEGGHITLTGNGSAQNVSDFFEYVEKKYADLMDNGNGVPRIFDVQLGTLLTGGWERTHFETFMRRIREAAGHARKAASAATVAAASAEWAKVFGDLWPTDEEASEIARSEAATVSPGVTMISATGAVVGSPVVRTIPTRITTFHGDPANSE